MQILHLTFTHEMDLRGRALSAPRRQFIAEGKLVCVGNGLDHSAKINRKSKSYDLLFC